MGQVADDLHSAGNEVLAAISDRSDLDRSDLAGALPVPVPATRKRFPLLSLQAVSLGDSSSKAKPRTLLSPPAKNRMIAGSRSKFDTRVAPTSSRNRRCHLSAI